MNATPAAIDHDARIGRQPRNTGRRLRGVIVHRLGVAIMAGEHKPGDVLPSETDAADALDVSRTAYRDAIRTLAAKGLVESRPRAGTRILPRHRWNLLDPDVLGWAFSWQPDAEMVRALFELRALVEPGAAALAARKRTRSDIRTMRQALASMGRHGLNTEAGRTADRRFHDTLLAATRNDYLISLSSSIGAAVTLTTQFKQRLRELPRDPVPDHRRVLDAIEAGDEAAASTAMCALVTLALKDTEQSMA